MALTATYFPDMSRIYLDAGSLGASATYARFDRSVDGGITWTTVRGGTAAFVVSQVSHLNDYEFPNDVDVVYRVRSYNASNVLQQTFTTTINQPLTEVWLTAPARPFLNRPVLVTGVGEVTMAARTTVFPIVGRSNPIGVVDVRLARQFDLEVFTDTPGEADALRFLAMSGEPIMLHAPPGFPVPTLYAVIGDVTVAEPARGNPARVFTFPLSETAAPGSDIVATTYTIQSMLNEYATVSAVIADNARIIDLIERVASPSEVIVG